MISTDAGQMLHDRDAMGRSIAGHLALESSALTPLLKRLETAGW